MFYAVSTNGTSNYLVQVGNGSVVTSGYSSGVQQGAVYTSSGAGLIFINAVTAADNITGIMVVTNITGNTWTSSSNANRPGNQVMCGAGNIPLAGTLDRIRITTVNGTDTFDAGSINIMWE